MDGALPAANEAGTLLKATDVRSLTGISSTVDCTTADDN